MLLHSFATNETGVIEERTKLRDGSYEIKYRVSEGYKDGVGEKGTAKGRTDGINGLMKLVGISPDSSGYINNDDYAKLERVLDKVRSSALYSKKQSEIVSTLIQEIKNEFGIDLAKKGKLNTRIIFKSSDMPGKNSEESSWFSKNLGFSKFFKSVKEKVRGLFTDEGEHVIPT
jgi:hypothetical protein